MHNGFETDFAAVLFLFKKPRRFLRQVPLSIAQIKLKIRDHASNKNFFFSFNYMLKNLIFMIPDSLIFLSSQDVQVN